MTEQPSSIRDIEESIAVVTEAMVKEILKLPPRLGVQLSTIHRCLREYLMMRTKLQEMKAREDE